jgi:molecular chaperone GrpE
MEEKTPQELKKSEESAEAVSKGKTAPAQEEKVKPETELEHIKAELDKKTKETQEYNNKYLRTYAELENFKKRAIKEKSDWIKHANEDLLKEFLTVLDNLSRAKDHGNSSTELSQWLEGVSLTIKQFEDILARYGVKPIKAMGASFDPSVHQAMSQMESDKDEGIIIDEFQKGYCLHDRVLRPAMVVVAKKKRSEKKKEGGGNHG